MSTYASPPPDLTICLTGPLATEPNRLCPVDLADVLREIGCTHETVIAECDALEASRRTPKSLGYRAALSAAVQQSSGRYVVTSDSFMAVDPYFLLNFWAVRERADMIVASRFAPGGVYHTGFARRVAARALNGLARWTLSLPYHDLTSAFRMYRRESLVEALARSESTGYEFLVESIVQLHGLGRAIEEIPFVSRRAPAGRTNVPGGQVAWPLAASLTRLWRLRNSVFSADYDERAFNSWIWPQRYWQRKRFEIITGFVDSPAGILDIGCGSSKIIQAFPGAIGLDILLKKLRYLLRRRARLVQGSAFRLPFADHSFRTVICSEVIEHIPFAEVLFDEFHRVLCPGGVLILGTPDYGTWVWPTIEWLYAKIIPGGYAQEHITHYTADRLRELLQARGFRIEAERRICRAELILKSRLGRWQEHSNVVG